MPGVSGAGATARACWRSGVVSGNRHTYFLTLLSALRVFPLPATLSLLTAGSIIPTQDTNRNTNNTAVTFGKTWIRMFN